MTKIKDPISFLSHAIGAVLSVVGLVFLIIYSASYGEGEGKGLIYESLRGHDV